MYRMIIFSFKKKKERKRKDQSLDVGCRLGLKIPGPKPISWKESLGEKSGTRYIAGCTEHEQPSTPKLGRGL